MSVGHGMLCFSLSSVGAPVALWTLSYQICISMWTTCNISSHCAYRPRESQDARMIPVKWWHDFKVWHFVSLTFDWPVQSWFRPEHSIGFSICLSQRSFMKSMWNYPPLIRPQKRSSGINDFTPSLQTVVVLLMVHCLMLLSAQLIWHDIGVGRAISPQIYLLHAAFLFCFVIFSVDGKGVLLIVRFSTMHGRQTFP